MFIFHRKFSCEIWCVFKWRCRNGSIVSVERFNARLFWTCAESVDFQLHVNLFDSKRKIFFDFFRFSSRFTSTSTTTTSTTTMATTTTTMTTMGTTTEFHRTATNDPVLLSWQITLISVFGTKKILLKTKKRRVLLLGFLFLVLLIGVVIYCIRRYSHTRRVANLNEYLIRDEKSMKKR